MNPKKSGLDRIIDVKKMVVKGWKKFMRPPKYISGISEEYYTEVILNEWRMVRGIDIIIYTLMLTVVMQLAYVFGKGDPEISHYAKAFGFAFSEVYFAKSVFSARKVKSKEWPIWVFLIVIVLIIIPLNLSYEWAMIAERKSMDHLATWDSEMVSKDIFTTIYAVLSSAIIGVLIIGLSYVRTIREKRYDMVVKELDIWRETEKRRESIRISQAKFRAKKRNGVPGVSAKLSGKSTSNDSYDDSYPI